MDRKLLIPIVAVLCVLVLFTGTAQATNYYESVYKHADTGDAYTVLFWNTRWAHLDNRIDALEDFGSLQFKTFSPSSGADVVADSSTDTLTLTAGANITITGTAATDTIVIAATTTPLDFGTVAGAGGTQTLDVVEAVTDACFDSTNFAVAAGAAASSVDVDLVDDPTIAGYLTVTEYILMPEWTETGNPAANYGWLYVADDSSTTKLYFEDSAGTITNLLASGTDEAIEDVAGAMWTGNTETLITITYQDATADIDAVVESDLNLYSWTNVDATDLKTGSVTQAYDADLADLADGTLSASAIEDKFLRNDAADTTVGNLTLNTVAPGDSPSMIFNDGGGKTFSIAKADAGETSLINNEGAIYFKPSNDLDDYVSFYASGDASYIKGVGSNLYILADGGTVNFGDENITTTGTITGTWSPTLAADVLIDDGVGDSPKIILRNANDKDLQIYKMNGAGAVFLNNDTTDGPSGDIYFFADNDTDDFLAISTNSDIPMLFSQGDCNLNLRASGANGEITLQPNADADDYWEFSTTSNVPRLSVIGDANMELYAETNSEILLYPNGDTSDYWEFSTSSDEPILRSVGSTSMNFGDASVTDFTVITDSTGDAEVVLPNDSIGPSEVDSTTGAWNFGSVTSFEIPNANDVSANITEGMLSWDADDDVLYVGDGADLIPMGGGSEAVGYLAVNFVAPSDAASLFAAVDIEMNVAALAADSELHAIDVAATGTTSGGMAAIGVHDAVDVIHQNIGTLSTPSQTEYAGEIPNISGTWSDGIDGNTIFEADDDEIYIGSGTVFSEIAVDLSTVASADETLIFEYQHTDTSWDPFTPIDGSNGMRQDGTIIWESGNLTSWKSDSDPAGADGSSGYWIRIRRTRNNITTDPIVTTMEIEEPTFYFWDAAAVICVIDIIADSYDGLGAVDQDYGSVDVLDHSFTTNDCTFIIDGGITISTGDNIVLGTTTWNSGDDIDGEQIADNSIDTDSLDWANFGDNTYGGDITLDDDDAGTALTVRADYADTGATIGVLITTDDDDNSNYTPFEIRDDSGTGNDLLASIDYQGRFVCKSVIPVATTWPASPTDGELLFTPATSILFQYDESAWNPIINYASTLALYVNAGSGGDVATAGFGSGVLATETIQYCWDNCVPAIFNGVITINVDGATYAEELIFSGKTPGSSTAEIILLGELTALHNGTADADSTTGVLEDDANPWGGGPEVGNLLMITGGTGDGDNDKFIRADDADSLTPAGLFDTAPDATTTYTIYSLATIVQPGAGNTGLTLSNQANVTIKYINFDGGAFGIDISDGCQDINITSCEIDTATTTGMKVANASSITVNTAYVHAAGYKGIEAVSGSIVTLYDTYVLGCNTVNSSVAAGVKASASVYILFWRCYIDGNNKYGVLNQYNGVIQFLTGANISSIVNHDTGGDVGVKSNYGAMGTSVVGQTYVNNNDDEDADAATFSVHT